MQANEQAPSQPPKKKKGKRSDEARFSHKQIEAMRAAALILPAVILLLVVGIYPLLYALNTSFRSFMLTQPGSNGEWIGLENYIDVINDPLFWAALRRTLFHFLWTVPTQIILGIGIALLLQKTRWRTLAGIGRVLLVIPFAITPTVIGLMGRLFFNRDFGIINYLLSLIGVEPVNWMGNQTMAFMAVGFIEIWQWTPFVALIMLAGLTMVPEETLDAAHLETNNWFTIFRHIQLPYLLPGLTAALIIRTAEVVKLFDMPYTMLRGGPGSATEFISVYIHRVGFRIFDLGTGSAQAILVLIFTIIISRLYVEIFYREVETG
jgi:multiple sugar transport system permease protein